MTGKIFVITGPSGVGKGTLCQLLLERSPDLRLSVSATSRAMRPGETDGVNYHFKTREQFEAMIAHDRGESVPEKHQLLEWAEYNGNYYGTPREAVQQLLDEGKSVLLEIEVQGALIVKEKFPEACLIFITPPDMEELERRLRGRGTDADENIRQRLEISRREMELRHRFDYVISNCTLDTCVDELEAIIRSV